MLVLPIKKKWFDMIISGEKKEEYRSIKGYYVSMLDRYFGRIIDVKFRNGYSKTSPYCICKVLVSMGKGKQEWGAEKGFFYYILIIKSIEYYKS